jgi:hypothetical protein
MERLHPLALALAVSVCLAVPGLLQCQSACSLRVRVLSPDGARPHVAVSVEERNGRKVEKDQNDGDVEFCDLGALPVTVRVGDDKTCNQVVVREVPIRWNDPYTLNVTWQFCKCTYLPPPVPLCQLVFRVSDTKGKWVPDAVVEFLGRSQKLTADQYGRIGTAIEVGITVRGDVVAPGFGKSPFRFACTLEKPVHELPITLGERGAKSRESVKK